MTVDELLANKKATALVEKALGKPILRPDPPEVPTEVGYILAGDHAMFGVASSEARFWRQPLPDAYPDSPRRTPGPAVFDIQIDGDVAGTVVTSAVRNATGIDIIATPSNESVSGEDMLDVLKGHFVEAARRIYPEDEISFLIRPAEEAHSLEM